MEERVDVWIKKIEVNKEIEVWLTYNNEGIFKMHNY